MHKPQKIATTLALSLAALVLAPISAQAQDGPTPVEYRQSIMQTFRTHMGGIGAAMGDAAPMGHAEHHAVAFERMAQALANVFPEGTTGEDSRALAVIWENRDDFTDKVTAIQTAAARLVTASRSGDAEQIGSAMRGVQQTCRGCHQTYRGPAN